MFVYSKVTSSVTKRVPDGKVGNLLSLLIKSVVSQMYNRGVETQRCKKQSTKHKILSVRAPFEDTIGLPGFPGL